MRPEMREYKFDWMLLSAFESASRLKAGTEKEYRHILNYIPYFRGVTENILAAGEPGRLFIEMLAQYMDNIVNARARGKKTAITTFCFSPAIFYAMDIIPVCLEVLSVMQTVMYRRGSADFLDFCNEAGYTETSCSAQRGSLGAYLAGAGAEIDLIVTDTPGVCDTNANAFAFASGYLRKPFFQLNMPPNLKNENSDRYHVADFKALISFLEEHSGKKLEEDRLREILVELEKQDEMIGEIEELARMVPNPLHIATNLLVYAGRYMFAGMQPYTELLKAILDRARDNAEKGTAGLSGGSEKLRGFFCYIDHYTHSLRLWQMLDKFGIGYQGNILSRSWASSAPHVAEYGTQDAAYSIDTLSFDSMIRSIAMMNSRMPMVKSIRGPYDAPDMWLQDTLSLAKMYRADFIVYNGTPGCRNTWGMVKLLARDTEKAGIPTFIMYADAFDDRVESWEVTQERFEEFLRVRRLIV